MARDWALCLHLLGALLFVGGSIAVAALRLLAIGGSRPSTSALLLRSARTLVPLLGVGVALTFGAGAWLAHDLDVAYGSDLLRRTLRDPVALALDGPLLVATVAIVALMVWQP